jgi:RHS repeat-associated protein
VVFTKGTTGAAETVHEDHYYPFGLQLSGQSFTNTTLLNKYLFNGKEKQDQTGMYDYGFRQLDPVLGVWHSADKLAESTPWISPYAYAGNDPINNVDLLGLKEFPSWKWNSELPETGSGCRASGGGSGGWWDSHVYQDGSILPSWLGGSNDIGPTGADYDRWLAAGSPGTLCGFYQTENEDARAQGFINANHMRASEYGHYERVAQNYGSNTQTSMVWDDKLKAFLLLGTPEITLRYVEGDQIATAPLSSLAPQQDYTGFWGFLKYILTGGNAGWYHYNLDGKAVSFAPRIGFPPIPAKGINVLQYGDHILQKGTLKALEITKEEGKIGIESLKEAHGLPPDFHGIITSDGSYWSRTWEYIDNILEYIK